MIICIPSSSEDGLESEVGMHFGRVPFYTIVEGENIRVIKNTSSHMGGNDYPPEIMKKEGVEIMLCRDIGGRAVRMFLDMGIEVYTGANGKVKDALESFKEGELIKLGASHICRGHGD